jgi:serine/threonine protein kinase/formylglycine-generating enzyme required for sulfatase activity
MATEDVLIGKEVGGCLIEGKLGQGGMGAVYRARQVSLQREVAIKVINEAYMANDMAKARFEREAQAVAQITHPNIVQVHDLGKTDDGSYYIVMEMVEGGTVSDVMKAQKILREREALEITRQAAAGLQAAADKSIIHRDIKPDNLMLTTKGQVKVADFGLAKNTEATGQLTHSGQIMGTPAYIAPEQADGRKADNRSDIYSLGATLFAIATGTMPYAGETAIAIVMQHINAPTPEPKERNPELSDRTCAIIKRMMEKDPAMRYQSAEQVIHDIDVILQGKREPLLAETPGPIQMGELPTILGDLDIPDSVKADGPPTTGGLSVPTPQTIDAKSLAEIQKRQSKMMMILGIAGTVAVVAVIALVLVVVLGKDKPGPGPGPGGTEPGKTTEPGSTKEPDGVPIVKIDVRITSHSTGAFVTDDVISIRGQLDYTNVTSLKVNGQKVHPDGDGGFVAEVPLKEGENPIEVEARGENAEGRGSIIVHRDETSPVVQITKPAGGKTVYTQKNRLAIEGTVQDRYPKSVIVDRRSVKMEEGKFRTEVNLRSGRNEIVVEARDKAENLTSETVVAVLDTKEPGFRWFPKIPAKVYSENPKLTVKGEVTEDVKDASFEGTKLKLNGRRITVELRLKKGKNRFVFSATDLAGNKGTHEVVIQYESIPGILRKGTRAGEFICQNDGAVMVLVDGGEGWMGNQGGRSAEKPRHRVKLSAFYMDKHEVTNRQYGRFLAWVDREADPHVHAHPDEPKDKNYTPKFWDDRQWNKPDGPVVGVDWFDAWAYARWAGKDLPTEAEWEFAAAWDPDAGRNRTYPWGEEAPTSARAVFSGSRPENVRGRPGGASPWGCLDMAGNVQEWVLDWFDPAFYRRAPALNPRNLVKGPKTRFRVLRGGAWKDRPDKLRTWQRGFFLPTGRYNSIGFRCVLRVKKK